MPENDAGITIATATTKGRRAVNQDAVIARRMDPARNRWGLQAIIGVADGMGGHAAGEVASKIAADTVEDVLGLRIDDDSELADSMRGMSADEALASTVRLADRHIHRQGTEHSSQEDMGTTLTVVAVDREAAHVAHVGDTRGYLLDESGIHQVTQDHSWVARQVRDGHMTEKEAASSPMRAQLTRTLGGEETVDPDMLAIPLKRGCIYLVCSDGLTEVLSPQEIRRIIADAETLQQGCDRLMQAAKERGTSDNATVACVEIGRLSREAIAGAEPGEQTDEMYPAFEVRSRSQASGPQIRRIWPLVAGVAVILLIAVVFTVRSCVQAPGQEAQQAAQPQEEPPEVQPPLKLAPLEDGLNVRVGVKDQKLVVVANRHLTTTVHPPDVSDAEPAIRISPESWYERELSQKQASAWSDKLIEITLYTENNSMKIETLPEHLDIYINNRLNASRTIPLDELDGTPARVGFYFPANDRDDGFTVAFTQINPANLPERGEEGSE
ncbi:MAG: protein phosphatase 2C domain-containing protein [Armatimonadota bacterium]